ncbi:MAG: hypothetical protein J6R03_03985 [Treponema sp.]|nr:hypothetical protein [Treponema sp.]
MKTKEKFMMYVKIAQRAEGMGIYNGERFTLLMDLENADNVFNLRLEELLNADDGNFAHDVVGIVNHIDRRNPTDFNLFVPRFAKN